MLVLLYGLGCTRDTSGATVPQGMTLDTHREQAGFLPVMRLRNRPAGGLKHFPWNAPFGQRVQKLRREGAVYFIDKLAGFGIDFLHAQVPDHAHFYPAGWRKDV